MIVHFIKIFCCVIFLLIYCKTQETTIKTIFIETTTEYVTIITDIPEEDVEEALNHDYGRYATQVFRYTNNQFYKHVKADWERCYDDYIKCLVTIIAPKPVCVVNDPYDVKEGFRTFTSYCDAYFDNCMRKVRFWHILDFGRCGKVWESNYYFNISKTRKNDWKSWEDVYEYEISNEQSQD